MEPLNMSLQVPHNVLAAGWIPFTVFSVLCFIFSLVFIFWFRSVRSGESSSVTTCVTIASLFFTLISAFLIPVDVFLVSYMKNSDGTYKPWASDPEVRANLQWSMMQAYYAFYGIILIFAFLILPFAFFFHALGGGGGEGEDAEPETFCKKFLRALKFSLTTLAAFAILVVLGVFLPFDGVPPSNDTAWQKLEFLVTEFESSSGDNLIVFLLNVVNIIGLVLIILYMSYGMTSLPLGMIRGRSEVHAERATVEEQVKDLEEQINGIRNRHQDAEIPHFEQQQVERLERQLRILQRARHDLNQRAKTFANRCVSCCTPFKFVFGVLCMLFGLLIFISLLLTSIDKAINSEGAKSGYILQNGTLPNPIDIVLVWAQAVFPLDYILYSGMILFLVMCSVSGVKDLGIRFLWLTVYKIKAHLTKPQALVMMCLNLIFMMVALSVIMFAIVPDYTTFGSQHFVVNVTVDDKTQQVVKRCSDLEPNPDCSMSRMAVLLLAFHAKAWIFGAAYFYLVWAFLAMVVVSSLICMFRFRRSRVSQEEDDLEELLDDSNPFTPS